MIYIVFIMICVTYLIILILEAVERFLYLKKKYRDEEGDETVEKKESCIGFTYYPEDEDY